MEQKKYELVQDDTIQLDGKTLYRIRAIRDFGKVKKGDLGGYVEGEHNLSHEDECWVYDNAKVHGNARLNGNASVYEEAEVYGNAPKYDANYLKSLIEKARPAFEGSTYEEIMDEIRPATIYTED